MVILKCLLYVLLIFVFISSLSAETIVDDQGIILSHRPRRETEESDTAAKIRNLLLQAQSKSGDVDINALLTEHVHDPVSVDAFNVSNDGFFTSIFGQFTDLYLHGLKGFQVDKISMNLATMNLSAYMSVPMLSVIGNYFLNGTVTFFSVTGQGPFWMNLSSIDLYGHSLIHTTEDGRLSMGDIKLDSNVGDIALHFENLMGGGTWGTISNNLLNQLSELILGELKHILLRELSFYLKQQFNDVLFKQLPEGLFDPEASNIVDGLLSEAAVYMMDHGIEPLILQEYKEVYERNILFVTTRGEFKVYNGTLHGLSTIRRKGDVIAVFANNSLLFEADFEFENLTGSYSWLAEAFGTGTRGTMEIQIKEVEGFIRIRQELTAGSKLELDELYVKDIRQVWLDLQGLGRWDYIMESAINLVTNGLKLQLADAITKPIKIGVQNELDMFNIGIPSSEENM